MRTRDFFFVVLAATLWGAGGVAGVELARHADIHPLAVAMWRMLIAGLFLVTVQSVRRTFTLSYGRTAWVRILATATLTAAFEALFFTALTLASVGLTTLIAIGSTPVFVAIYDWTVRKERPGVRTFVALGLALGGLVLLLSGSLSLGGNAVWGALLALVTGASFAGISVVNRVPIAGLEPVPLTALAFTIGGSLLIPIAAIPGLGAASDAVGWALTLVLGIVITACAYVAYLAGLRTVPPFVATIVALLEPVIAAALGAIILGERLGRLGIVGGVVLGAAVVLLRPQREEPESIH